MPAKWQRVKIEVPEHLTPDERQAVALEIIDFIRERTQKKNLDKNNRPFPAYSASYVKSLDFKIAGKSKGKVDLTLSGDMLGALDLLSHKKGILTIGFEKGSTENARADGNIRGTYGNKSPVSDPRDFLGIDPKDLNSILKKYPATDPAIKKDRVDAVLNILQSDNNVVIDGEEN